MPRAKIKTAEPIVTTTPFCFTPAIKEDLIDLLGYDPCSSEQTSRAHEAIELTAQAAGNYLGAAELASELPRTANMRAEIKAFLKMGDFSDEAWLAMHPWTRHNLSKYGASGTAPPSDKKAIISACEQYLRSNPAQPSGRLRLEARARLVKELCRIFHGYGSREAINDAQFDADGPELTERSRRGAVSSYSPLEHDRHEFIGIVFGALGIPLYKDLHEDIVIQANTTNEHARRLDIIASRSRRQRKKQQQLGQPNDHMYLFPDG